MMGLDRTARASHTAPALALALTSALTLAACGSETILLDPGTHAPVGAVLLVAEDVVSIQGSWSGFDEATRTVIRDDEAWAAAWETMHAQQAPAPERPDVDFTSHVIVLAAMGTRPNTGYSIQIERVHAHDGELYVSVLERSPGPSCITGQAMTAPVHVIQVAREGTSAHFSVNTETVSCQE